LPDPVRHRRQLGHHDYRDVVESLLPMMHFGNDDDWPLYLAIGLIGVGVGVIIGLLIPP
jgi:hypothetical protein